MRSTPLLLATVCMLLVASIPYASSDQTGLGVVDASPSLAIFAAVDRAQYSPGEPVHLTLQLRNDNEGEVLVFNPMWRVTVYYVPNATATVPMTELNYIADYADFVVLGTGDAVALLEDSAIWDARHGDGSAAEHGLYLVEAISVGMPFTARGTAVFTVGPAGVPALPLAESLSLVEHYEITPGEEGEVGILATGGSAGYGAFGPRWSSFPQSWYYNGAGAPSSIASGALAEFQASFTTWENVAAAYDDFNYVSTTSNCACSHFDNVNVMGWASSLPGNALGIVTTRSSGGVTAEADMEISAAYTWSLNGASGTYDLRSTVTHEAGHARGTLADLYNPGHPNYAAWMGSNNGAMTMYGVGSTGDTSRRTLEWGDMSGIRYYYPVRNTGPASIGDSTDGSGAEVWDIDGNGLRDVVVAWVDDPAGGNNIYYRVGWSLSSSTGAASSWTASKTAATSIGDSTQGLGVAAANLDGDSRLELIVAWADDPFCDNTIYYKIGWNINTAGDAAGGWSATKTVGGGGIGCTTAGVGVCLANVDGTAAPEMFVAWVDDPSGGNSIKFRVGQNINSAGNAVSWSSTKTAATSIGDATQGLGLTCANLNESGNRDLVFAYIDAPSGENYVYYYVGLDPNSSGDPASYTARKAAPGVGVGSSSAGLGVASAEIDNAGTDELYFVYVDDPSGGNTAYYRTEWNGRYNSHG